MNFKILPAILLLLINVTYARQVTYFIKYKNNIEKSSVALKVSSQQLSPGLKKNSPQSVYSVKNLADNLGYEDENLSRIVKVTFSDQAAADDYLNQLQSDNSIEYIQPSTTYKVESIPNDSLISSQWALEKIGVFNAWDITTGSDKILLAIIDTGIEFFHPDLKNNIYYNPGETGTDQNGDDKSSNNVDDDNNGFIDDYMGWDFTDRTSLPNDTTVDIKGWDNYPYDPVRGIFGFHGTSVAGIAGATSNNISGIAGVAPGIRLLNLRAFDNTGNGEEDDVASAILYAVKMNVRVINMSFGDTKFSYVLRDVIRYAYSKNIVLVASSGNERDTALADDPHYPSGFDEVISVGNSTKEDYYDGSYGSTLDLLAPGTSILSTDMYGKYSEIDGTSASAPHVSASAALILSINNNFTNEEVKQILKSTCDDIGSAGWDLKTGAGRLNLYKALTILSPAKIHFNYPYQDFATFQDTIKINTTVMSPYFVKYSLMYGEGINPADWKLLYEGEYQHLNDNITTMSVSQLAEGDYTFRLLVSLTNGSTTEERINFHIQRTAPEMLLVGTGPVYKGETSTLMGELYTSSLAVTRMYYRQKGTGNFNFITLDGYAANIQFVKQIHYGFIPEQLTEPNTLYEIYFEAENLAGLKSTLINDDDNYFEFKTDPVRASSSAELLQFSLPPGSLFENPVNFLTDSYNEILFSSNSELPDSLDLQYSLYTLEGISFKISGSLNNRIPVEAGDFNNNGKTDLLSRFYPGAFLSEQDQPGSFIITDKFQKDASYFYPILAGDINNDGRIDVVSNYYSSTTKIFKINDDLSLDSIGSVNNVYIDSVEYSQSGGFYNTIFKSSAITADGNGDGINELWTIDSDGDLYSYIFSGGNFIKSDSLIENVLITSQDKIISSGDYNGDGSDDIAVLYTAESIASYFVLRIISFKDHKPDILFERVFLDQSAEYSGIFSKTYLSIKMADIDNDNKAELILNIFPDVYIFKFTGNASQLVYFDEGISTETIFAGDLNQNGVKEIGLQYADGYKFYEFSSAVKPGVPVNLAGYSIDSSTVFLQWTGNTGKYLVYKGADKNSLQLYDSTQVSNFEDNQVLIDHFYYYAIKQVDATKEIPLSEMSKVLEVYSHNPARALNAEAGSQRNIIVYFSENINTTVNNLQSFEVEGLGFPNSVSAASENSYLVSFNSNFVAGSYKIIVKGLKDYYGSSINQDTLTFEIPPVITEQEFYITNHKIVDPYTITLSFNLDVNEAEALNISNYVFEPENHLATISVDQKNKNIIHLSLVKERPIGSIGKEYSLKINNVTSAGGIRINDGAGSYIVLTGYSENLSDVYVYPSPVKLKNGDEKMMFANLPRKANILILSLDGKILYSLEERDGNGGVEYNMKDEDNNNLNSGIYLYRIVRLDDNNNEVEEKIGKFAVIR